jgi:hypothetical protein
MEYILNNSKVPTTNGFKINNVKVDLDIPELNKDILEIDTNMSINQEYINNKVNSLINLELDEYLNIDIKSKTNDNYLKFNIDNNKCTKLNLDLENDNNIVIKLTKDIFNYLILNVNNKDNTNITILNYLDKSSNNLIAIEGSNQGNLNINVIDLGSNVIVNNIDVTNNKESAKTSINNIFIGIDNNLLDYNYYVTNNRELTNIDINVQGVLKDTAKSNFKGIIDFISGAKKSIGNEIENVILLSEDAKSKSMPVLLCGEEDVQGSHGVSTGKLDKEKIFYLMSRGLSESDAKRVLIKSNFNKVLSIINDENIINEIDNYIDEII